MFNMFIYVATYQAAVGLQRWFRTNDRRKPKVLLCVGSNMICPISCVAIFHCSLHIGVDVYAGVCSQAYSGVTARS